MAGGIRLLRMRLRPSLVLVQHGNALRVVPRVSVASLQAQVVHIVVDGLIAIAKNRFVSPDLVVARPDRAGTLHGHQPAPSGARPVGHEVPTAEAEPEDL